MTEIRFAGFGGQGIIRSGIIVGRAATIYDNKFATMTQSFGPEARGGACSSELLVADTKILYPYVTTADILVAMSQEAYEKFVPKLKDNGILISESELVKPIKQKNIKICAIPMTRIAEELGNKVVANVVMLGYLTAIAKVVSVDAMKKAVAESVPERFVELNIKAFDKGLQYTGDSH